MLRVNSSLPNVTPAMPANTGSIVKMIAVRVGPIELCTQV